MFFDANRFHVFVLFTWQFTIFFASQMIFPIFSNYVPEWRCGDGAPGKDCEEYKRCEGNVTFITESPFYSTAIEYGWVCENAYWRTFFAQMQFVGVLTGTLSFGTASDLFGRKPIALLALTIGLSASVLSGLASSVTVLLGARLFVGFSIGGALVVICTYVMEMLLPQQRMALRAFFNWGVARLLMTLICMFTGDWRMATFLCAAIAAPAFLIILFVFPESPTWLHSKGRLDEMRRSEKIIAKRAGLPYIPVPHRKLLKNQNLCSVLHGGGFKRLLVLWMMWFTASTCGYATDLNSNTISGDLFMNQVLFSILIWGSKMLLVTLDTHCPGFSRRLLHQGAQLGAIISFLTLSVLTVTHYEGIAFLVINLIGTVFVEYTWDACYLCAVESMETASRASATGSCSLVARIGAILSPTLTHLNIYWAASVYTLVALLGAVNLLSSYFFLVETKGVVLDNVCVEDDAKSLEEVEIPELKDEAAK